MGHDHIEWMTSEGGVKTLCNRHFCMVLASFTFDTNVKEARLVLEYKDGDIRLLVHSARPVQGSDMKMFTFILLHILMSYMLFTF